MKRSTFFGQSTNIIYLLSCSRTNQIFTTKARQSVVLTLIMDERIFCDIKSNNKQVTHGSYSHYTSKSFYFIFTNSYNFVAKHNFSIFFAQQLFDDTINCQLKPHTHIYTAKRFNCFLPRGEEFYFIHQLNRMNTAIKIYDRRGASNIDRLGFKT